MLKHFIVILLACLLSNNVFSQEKSKKVSARRSQNYKAKARRQLSHFEKSKNSDRINSNGTLYRWQWYIPLHRRTKDGYGIDLYKNKPNKKKGLR